MTDCKAKNIAFVNDVMSYRKFTKDFNISLFTPKNTYVKRAVPTIMQKERKKRRKRNILINQHIVKKELSIMEKKHEKEKPTAAIVVYDLQSSVQILKGDFSVYY